MTKLVCTAFHELRDFTAKIFEVWKTNRECLGSRPARRVVTGEMSIFKKDFSSDTWLIEETEALASIVPAKHLPPPHHLLGAIFEKDERRSPVTQSTGFGRQEIERGREHEIDHNHEHTDEPG
jgi:hypothetical protein